ncbi:MAG: cytochrome c oxidase subunit II, partial [Thermoanaerobaculia bacterium]
MNGSDRLRRLASYALPAAILLAASACSHGHPNSTLVPHSDFGREIDFLWDRLLLLGTIVFVLTEAALLFIVFKYRYRENQPRPPQTHGSTKLEITWTLIPAVILVFIAVPTVRAIVTTQAAAAPGSLAIDVTGHQWWWEFRYPEHGITTANEIYIPAGRTVNFRLRSADVIHSFWTPQLGGKRDVVTNRTNYLWLTPDSSTASQVWNGFCAEYCGTAHTYMRFRVFTVSPADFDSWVAGQKMPAQFGAVRAAASPSAAPQVSQQSSGTGATASFASTSSVVPGYIFPKERIPDYAVPNAP